MGTACKGVGHAVALTALLGLSCRPGGGASARGHDLLLITLDTVRADRIGAYGYGEAETPTLDRLARTGMRFEAAVATAPLTLPSHATLLTGLLPPYHGLRNNGDGRLPDDVETLATRLSAAGYRTGAFVGAFVLDRRFGLARGFDHYDDDIDRDLGAGLAAERAGAVVVDRALAWMRRDESPDRRPQFTWVHLYDAHAPYAPPEPFRSRHAHEPYDGEIASLDAQVGRLLDAVEGGPRAPQTVVAVVADHGEALGEHGELTHGLLVYEASLRVPLLLRAPQVLPAGRVVRSAVSLADLAPTLGTLLERPLGRASGRDLSPFLRRGEEPPERDLYAESEYPRTFGWSGLSCVRRGPLKYIAAPRAELYDLESDPGETRNLLPDDPRASEMERRLAGLRQSPRQADAPGLPDDEARERLASLGYAAGGPDRGPSRGPDAAAADPKDRLTLFRAFEEANWALQEGRPDFATERLQRLIAVDPTNPVFRGLLAQAYRAQGRLDRAIALHREVVARAPEDAEARYNLAVTLQEAGRPREALAALEEAIRRDSRRPEAHNALGIALFATGRPKEALARFERAVELDPRDARALNNCGNVLRELGRMEEARRAYLRASSLAPSYADPWNGLGALEVQRDRPAAALPYLERALAIAPGLHEARLNRAIALDTMGEVPQALDAYREFLERARDDPELAAQREAAARLVASLARRQAGAGARHPPP